MPTSPTYELIWSVVRRIPRGKVSTYGRIADISGFFGQPRLVGYALHALPGGTHVPWFRVINARGRISFPGRSRAFRMQKKLLEKDGIRMEEGVVDLVRYGWPKEYGQSPDSARRKRRRYR